ncbi:BTAD domain-containing putative transcriptional regulator [Streptomyces sp. Je 1-332]|uniref:BTAD domain-containing putative transcriptional regulator n=1 Tax=Streptomyces sp. Je 1-332 TaxID=3231270 RepID=UPI003459B4BE
MLGPLEAVSEGQTLPLGGTKQRAALGFLLLQPNQVVPSSQLLRALWSVEEPPATARKILQNAVWGLRRALAGGVTDDEHNAVELRTQAPGYSLRVDRDDIDLHLFHRWVGEGRAQLAAGAAEEASRLLREALELWRGPALSDLVEAGFIWPELTTLQNTRLDVQEDYFEARLASGQHYAVLGELESMVDAEPLRERSCRQLMLALYRCGRQADALSVYSGLRTALSDDLGLEPIRELQQLQQDILTHDTSLQAPVPSKAVTTAPRPQPTAREAESKVWERRDASVLLVRTGLGPGMDLDAVDCEDVDAKLAYPAARAQQEIEWHGGTVAGSLGDVLFGLFPTDPQEHHHAERAVRAAIAIRDGATGPDPKGPAAAGISVQIAVTTGEALMRLDDDSRTTAPPAKGTLLSECQTLLPHVPAHEIQVCGRTREATEPLFDYRRVAEAPDRWQVQRNLPEEPTSAEPYAAGQAEHRRELDLLVRLLRHADQWARTHRVTVLSPSDAARACLFTRFKRQAEAELHSVRPLFLSRSLTFEDDPYLLHSMILSAYCGVSEDDSSRTIKGKLKATLRSLAGDEGKANWLGARLVPFIDPTVRPVKDFGTEIWLEAWRQFAEMATGRRPLVLLLDDLHLAHEPLLDFIESLGHPSPPVPLMVIAGSRPELLHSRPDWASAPHSVTTITLPPGSDRGLGRPARPLPSLASRN